jgi:hypothetical protein
MTDAAPARPVCAAEGCHRPPQPFTGRGRPPIYCSPACRARTARRPNRGPILVEITHPPTTGRQRPAGRIWTVQLRRGTRTVTIATGLGATTAGALADQIADILRTSTHKGAAIN